MTSLQLKTDDMYIYIMLIVLAVCKKEGRLFMQLEYLKNYIKKDEIIEEMQVYEKDNLIHIPIKVKKLTIIYLSKEFILANRKPDRIPVILEKQFSRRNETDFRRMHDTLSAIQLQQTIFGYLETGLVYKVIEYRKNGMEVKKEYYIPSKFLQDYWYEKYEKHLQNSIDVSNQYRERIIGLKNKYEHPHFERLRNNILDEISDGNKISRRIDFFASVLIASSQSAYFDWKEIGLYSIGNTEKKLKTKVYDNQKAELLRELQKIIGGEPDGIGLTTVSGEYSAEFCARCKINFSFGTFDYKEAEFRSNVTDEEIFDIINIEKKDTIRLCLFENRAILRKIIKHTPAAERRDTAMISFDGQVRSSQYFLCRRWKEAGVKELVVWTDFDEYALSMIRKLYSICFEGFRIVIPMNGDLTLVDFKEAESYLLGLKDTGRVIEQEIYLEDLPKTIDLLKNGGN